ncbi:VCBS repeat-containing protein [candidate division TA06 bacterium]|nr:VCBS repeat-containing protein [candidate division TA06 bacterium]
MADTIHNYGDIRVGADKRWFLTISNQGASPLTIDSVRTSSPRFALLDPWLQNVGFPILIDSTSSVDLPVWFSPIAAETTSGNLTVYSNDGDEPILSVSLTGTGDGSPYPGGRVFWSYDAPGSASFEYIRSIRSLGDINGDGVDEVVASSENDTLYCFHGNGSGSGDILWTFVDGNPWNERSLMIIGDLDGDSLSDVIMGTAWADRSVHAISGRTGTEIWVYDSHEYGNGGWFYEVAPTGDIDGDNIPDVLACAGNDGMGTGPRRAYCLSGASGTKIWERFLNATGYGIQPIGDVTGDSVPDVACGTGDTNPNTMGVWGIDGATGDSLWFFEVGSAVWSVASIEDITGDGINDVIAGVMDGTLYALNGVNGDSIWAVGVEAFGIIEHVRIIGDVNGSGTDDILVAGTLSNFHCIEGSDGSSIWSLPSGQMNFTISPISDLTGDGVEEVIGGSGFSSNWVYCLDGTSGNVLWSIPNDGATESVWFIQDIDGNGYDDVLSGSRNGKIMLISGGDPSLGISEEKSRLKARGLRFQLMQNQPNPFLSTTHIRYTLPAISDQRSAVSGTKKTHVRLAVYDISGRLVRTLVDEGHMRGSHQVRWDGKDRYGEKLSSGVYFYRLALENGTLTRKLILLR